MNSTNKYWLFKPVKILHSSVKFVVEDTRLVARIFGQRYSYIDLNSVKAGDGKIFRDDVTKRLAMESSTVILRTACGCERVTEIDEPMALTIGFRVEFEYRSDFRFDDDLMGVRRKNGVRRFVWRNEYDKAGLKILDEQP
jgi:hypothetical protein